MWFLALIITLVELFPIPFQDLKKKKEKILKKDTQTFSADCSLSWNKPPL